VDHATPNLPSRDFEITSAFYARLGFKEHFRDGHWMILERGNISLEFFPHPQLIPAESWFSCCLWLDDLASFYKLCLAAGVAEGKGFPSISAPRKLETGHMISTMIDPDGSLIRMLQNAQ